MRTGSLGHFGATVRAPGMPGGALRRQVAIGDLASCARVLANAATGRPRSGEGGYRASFVAAVGDASHRAAIRIVTRAIRENFPSAQSFTPARS
jgi:hypothetical protein